MKLFTRLFLALLALWLPLSAALAATITITVGDNFYRGPDGTNNISMTTADVLVFQYNGQSSHPTMSDSSPAAWALFQMNAANRTRTFAAGTFTVGTYPFHCTAHFNQTGVLTVTQAVPTATSSASLAQALTVYPNPSRGQVTVQLDQKAGQDYKLRISNVIGQEVRTIALKPELTAAGLPLDLSSLPAGIYYYSLLVNDKTVATKRLVLQN